MSGAATAVRTRATRPAASRPGGEGQSAVEGQKTSQFQPFSFRCAHCDVSWTAGGAAIAAWTLSTRPAALRPADAPSRAEMGKKTSQFQSFLFTVSHAPVRPNGTRCRERGPDVLRTCNTRPAAFRRGAVLRPDLTDSVRFSHKLI